MFSSFLVLGKRCLITSSSSPVAFCHLYKREKKETSVIRASLMGILVWRVEETFPQARWCTWRALKFASTAASTGGDISAVLLGAWLTAAQLTKGAVGILGSEHFCEPLMAVAFGMCLKAAHSLSTNFETLQMKRPHQSNERGNRSVAILGAILWPFTKSVYWHG